jgi:cell division protein FtsB
MAAATATRAGRRVPRASSAAGPRLSAPAGVRWDRLGRLALLFVLVALLYLYLSAGLHMLAKWSQDRRASAAVTALSHEHARLERQHEALARQSTLEAEARQLGMVKPGEEPFVVTGLPGN